MKKQTLTLTITFLCLLSCLSTYAQKVIEKKFDHKNNKYVELEVPFASDIEVKTWDKPTVYFKANLKTKDGKYIDLYKLDVEETSNTLTISSDTKALFKAFEKDRKNRKWSNNGNCENQQYDFDYVLYVPNNAEFSVTSINGNMTSDIIQGDFEAQLINGDIVIKEFKGNLDLSTINGEIDLNVKDVGFVAETINGDIYADEKLDLKAYDKYVGQKVEGFAKGNAANLKLNTINGNMYLRF